MAYSPNEAVVWFPGTNNPIPWQNLITNDAELYSTRYVSQACAFGTFSVTGASTVTVCYFGLPGNHDNLAYNVSFVYGNTGGTGTIQLSISSATALDVHTTTVGAGSGAGSVTVTPSSSVASSTPRWGFIGLKTAAGETITITGLLVTVVPAAAASGVLASNYASVNSTWYGSNSPIPSSVVARLRENPFRIAADRVNAVYTFMDMTQDARTGTVKTGSTSFDLVLKILLPIAPPEERTYRIWAYVERYDTAEADLRIMLGSDVVQFTGSHGKLTTTMTIDGSVNANPLGNSVYLRSTTGASVALRTLQILEEPT